MAKILDKDPFTYQKERDSFLRDLCRFHASRGTSYSGFPCLGGKQVDLYLLYSKVTQLGGWVKVTDEQRWEDIQELFHIPLSCTNSAQALKIVYVR
ncbi:hypothetical protein LSH36_1037g00059 [Paralvinella palmiformis]|uniref:ARID domain-containing protein n=1 Tax=Paralvinella palmiformis TaxID=53620 RepID=A0AAD9IWA8_9ANNE|nr:hypothetical protein LSH36_1037g00059 [Paralvinella palmiformis]